MKGTNPTVEEKAFIDKICAIGCIVCKRYYQADTPASPHHMDGKTKPGAHFKVIPLCGKHHQEMDLQKPKRWSSRHGDGRSAFEEAYGTEIELYLECLELIGDSYRAAIPSTDLE